MCTVIGSTTLTGIKERKEKWLAIFPLSLILSHLFHFFLRRYGITPSRKKEKGKYTVIASSCLLHLKFNFL